MIPVNVVPDLPVPLPTDSNRAQATGRYGLIFGGFLL